MKKVLIAVSFLMLFGCATTSLEQRVSRLEQLQNAVSLTEMAGADARWRDGRTTEGTHNVDEITGMADGDWTIVIEEAGASSDVYIYIYDADADCSSADGLLQVNGTAAGDCWHLAIFHLASLVGEGADKFINVGQSSSPASPVDGDCYYDTDGNPNGQWCCYNGAAWECIDLDDSTPD